MLILNSEIEVLILFDTNNEEVLNDLIKLSFNNIIYACEDDAFIVVDN